MTEELNQQREAFNYGCEDIIQRIKKIINDLECKGNTLDGLRPKWIDAEELLKKLEELRK